MKRTLFFTAITFSLLFAGASTAFSQNPQTVRKIRQALQQATDAPQKVKLYLDLYDEYRRSQYDSAMTVAAEMTVFCEKNNDTPGRVAGLLRWATELGRKTRFDEANTKLEAAKTALSTIKNPSLESYALITEASLAIMQGNHEAALAACEKGIRVAEKHKDTLNLVLGHDARARLRFSMGDMTGLQADALECLALAQQAHIPRMECAAHRTLSVLHIVYYSDSTQFFYHANRCLELARQWYCTYDEAETLTQISAFNRVKGRFPEAIDYALQAVEKMKTVGSPGRYAAMLSGVGYVYLSMGTPEKATPWFEKALESIKTTGDVFSLAISYRGLGIALFDAGGQKEGIEYLETAYNICKKHGFREKLLDIAGELGKQYADLGDFKKAYEYKTEYQIGHDSTFNQKNSLEIGRLQAKYEFQKKEDSLLFDKKLGDQIRERQRLLLLTRDNELLLAQQLGEIQSFALQQKDDSLVRQKLALQLEQSDKTAQLAKAGEVRQAEVQRRRTVVSFLSVLLALAALLFIVFRLRSKLAQTTLQTKITESEMTALRAQMNPHFIFNSLNSINAYVLRNESKTANTYLTEFAHLMRQMLDNAAQETIPLEDELDFINSYLRVEGLRLENKLTWSVHVSDEVDIFETLIPTMILQPYVENAVWHGIAPKPEGGSIVVSVSRKSPGGVLLVVEDNGVGRTRAQALQSASNKTHQSKGQKITAGRLALYDQKHGSHSTITTIDLFDEAGHAAGTRVEIDLQNA